MTGLYRNRIGFDPSETLRVWKIIPHFWALSLFVSDLAVSRSRSRVGVGTCNPGTYMLLISIS
jgi:hypothetical protein